MSVQTLAPPALRFLFIYDKVQDQGIRAMSVGDQIEVAPNKLLCIAQFHSWPQMTFAKKMNAKALFLFKIWPKIGDAFTHIK